MYNVDPPVWDPGHFGWSAETKIPAELECFLPLPPQVASNVVATVCLPFYTEDGFALRRGLEALALQAADLRHYHSAVRDTQPDQLPVLHVLAVVR